jgi:hypothetical protein
MMGQMLMVILGIMVFQFMGLVATAARQCLMARGFFSAKEWTNF